MFERFSDNAKKAMSSARREAIRLRHEYIAPEHLLLGLLQLPNTNAVRLLAQFGVDAETLRAELEHHLEPGAAATAPDQLPFTPSSKRVLELTLEEAARTGSRHIGSEHFLLGLIREEHSLPAKVLAIANVGADAVRTAVAGLQPAPMHSTRRLLLISNSTMHGGGYLEHCAAEIRDFLGAKKTVLFVPYALQNHDEYAAKARGAFAKFGHDLVSVHQQNHSPAAVEGADAVFVGGGNTFRLLNALYLHGLLAAIQNRAAAGMPYIGSSAGTNVATLSIRTTNDMPIVQPPSFTALQLVPFQINPHYLDPDPASRHMGETREERIRQFLEEHTTPVLGLREGCMLRVEGDKMELRGTTGARLFRRDAAAQEFVPPCDLSFLLQV